MRKAVTIKSIAEALNLSRNTVAKALNGRYVPEKTRAAVLKKAAEMHYKSLDAKDTSSKSEKYRILLVSGKPLNNIKYFIPFIGGIEQFCYEHNHELFQYTFNYDTKPFYELSSYVKSLNIDGIITVECFDSDFVQRLLNLKKPVVFTDFTCKPVRSLVNYDVVCADDVGSAQEIVILLNKKYGISKFSFIGDTEHCMSFNDRYTGMLAGLFKTNTPHHRGEDLLKDDYSFDYGNAENLKTEILKLKYRPECFVCCNDFVARTVCNALAMLSVSVPDDAMVVGFDNVPEAYSLVPKLTSYAVDKKFLGKATVQTLIQRISFPEMPTRRISVSAKLIVRESTLKSSDI